MVFKGAFCGLDIAGLVFFGLTDLETPVFLEVCTVAFSVFSGFSEADLAKGSVAAWEGVCFWNTVAGFCCTR